MASDIVEAIRMDDQRFGVEPKEKIPREKGINKSFLSLSLIKNLIDMDSFDITG